MAGATLSTGAMLSAAMLSTAAGRTSSTTNESACEFVSVCAGLLQAIKTETTVKNKNTFFIV